METQQQRGRSPSNGRQNDLSHSRSHSAHDGFNSQANARGVDAILLQQGGSYDDQSLNNQAPSTGDSSFLGADYSAAYPQQQGLPFLQQQDSFPPYIGQQSHPTQSLNLHTGNSIETGVNPHFLDNNTSAGTDQQDFEQLLFDPALTGTSQEAGLSSNLPDGTADMQRHASDSSGYFPQNRMSHGSISGQQHQAQQGNWDQQAGHARNSSLDPSSAAFQHPGHGNEWANMYRGHQRQPSDFSDVSSSAHPSPFLPNSDNFEPSNGNSPLFPGVQDPSMISDFGQFSLSDSQMQQQHQQSSQHRPSHISPGHSPHVSPSVSPNHAIPPTNFEDPNMSHMMNNMNSMNSMNEYLSNEPGPEMFGAQGDQTFAGMQQPAAQESGDLMSPPEISIEPPQDVKPMTAESRESSYHHDDDALSPPSRNQRRPRAVSDTSVHPSQSQRSQSNTDQRSRAPSLGLSPISNRPSSRSPSPSASAGISKSRYRSSSTSSIPHDNRWLLGLQPNPDSSVFAASRPTSPGPSPTKQEHSPSQPSPTSSNISENASSNGGGAKRAQKHPATFQCHLCPKRFTRAYNLRSHLRTHTDERPFVCTICGKAFARQHDRKRHEGLHSGEKKFVCKGLLGSARNGDMSGVQATWGCGRRFARADALGRHFRSEAGRGCIKPLLEEEERERQAARMEQASYDMMAQQQQQHAHQQQQFTQAQQSLQVPGAIPIPNQPLTIGTGQGMTLPAALLAQYPALAGIQWDALGTSPGSGISDGLSGGEEDVGDMGWDEFEGVDPSGRSSFEASSGGEFDYEDDGGYDEQTAMGMGMGGQQGMGQPGMPQQHQQHIQQGWPGGQ